MLVDLIFPLFWKTARVKCYSHRPVNFDIYFSVISIIVNSFSCFLFIYLYISCAFNVVSYQLAGGKALWSSRISIINRSSLSNILDCGFLLSRDNQITCVLCFVGLCSLNIEHCSITSRTIQKVADGLSAGSVLEQLCIGMLDLPSRS